MASKTNGKAEATKVDEAIPQVIRQGDIARAFAGIGSTSNGKAEIIIGLVLGLIKGAVQSGRKVVLMDFGTFDAPQRPARKARNPQTGQMIDVPARRVVRFRAAKAFKEAVAVAGTASGQPASLLGSPEAVQAAGEQP